MIQDIHPHRFDADFVVTPRINENDAVFILKETPFY